MNSSNIRGNNKDMQYLQKLTLLAEKNFNCKTKTVTILSNDSKSVNLLFSNKFNKQIKYNIKRKQELRVY